MNRSVNLETFSLLWLDANVHTTADNINSQTVLRRAINFLRIFDRTRLAKSTDFSWFSKFRRILIFWLYFQVVKKILDDTKLSIVAEDCKVW